MNREEHGLGSADVAEAVCLGSSAEPDGRLVLLRAFLLRRAYGGQVGGQGASGSEGNGRKECRNIRGGRPRLHRARLIRVHSWLLIRGASQERDAICVRAALRGHPKWPPQIWQVARMRGKGLMPGVDGQRDSGIRRSFPAGRPALPGKRGCVPVGEQRRLAGGNAPHAKEAGVNGSLQERLEREVTAGQRRAGEG